MKHLLIIGGGPAGTAAATTAAARGCRVTLVEKSIVGGAAHLWDCIPSKTMTATAVRIDSIRNAAKLGLVAEPGQVDPQHLAARISKISEDITSSWNQLLASQSVDIVRGTGRFVGPNTAEVETETGTSRIEFDSALISTGSSPRVPRGPTSMVSGSSPRETPTTCRSFPTTWS